jgi:hypothetical protein
MKRETLHNSEHFGRFTETRNGFGRVKFYSVATHRISTGAVLRHTVRTKTEHDQTVPVRYRLPIYEPPTHHRKASQTLGLQHESKTYLSPGMEIRKARCYKTNLSDLCS